MSTAVELANPYWQIVKTFPNDLIPNDLMAYRRAGSTRSSNGRACTTGAPSTDG